MLTAFTARDGYEDDGQGSARAICLIAIHHWGWTLTLHPDGTTTATSPDHQRIYHSHSPPSTAA